MCRTFWDSWNYQIHIADSTVHVKNHVTKNMNSVGSVKFPHPPQHTHSRAHTQSCACTHTNSHTHTHSCANTHTLARTHTHSRARTDRHMHTRTHTYTLAHTHTRAHTHTLTCAHTCTHTRAHTCTCTHTYIYETNYLNLFFLRFKSLLVTNKFLFHKKIIFDSFQL